MNGTTKEFGPIRDDYTFFEDHSTEAAEDVRAYVPQLRALVNTSQPVRMLDFGCAEGRFTSRLLEHFTVPPNHLHLSLVEPDDVYRREAVRRLQSRTAHPIPSWPSLPPDLTGRFDLVLANHVFYYVPNLEELILNIVRATSDGGVLIAAMAGQENRLIQFWNHCFALLGKPVPFNTAEDLESVAIRHDLNHQQKEVSYELSFPDSEANRLSIMRFLLGVHFNDVPRKAMLDLFNPYSAGGNTTLRITHRHFVIKR